MRDAEKGVMATSNESDDGDGRPGKKMFPFQNVYTYLGS
jgi:hypothetical protein